MRCRTRAGLAGAALVVFGLAAGVAGAEGENGVRVALAQGELPREPADERWRGAPETRLALTEQIILPPVGGGGVSEVALRALHDGESLAIRLEWEDSTADRQVGVSTFRDSVAVGFPVQESASPPSPFMGDARHPVAIWQWTADLEAEALGQGGFSERYPHTQGVWYFPQDAMVHREVRSWRATEPVAELTAKGYGTLKPRPVHNVLARSEHADGRWAVVLRRALSTGDPEDAAFRPGERRGIIVAVWDGSRGEVNGRKSVTLSWTPFLLDTTVAADDER